MAVVSEMKVMTLLTSPQRLELNEAIYVCYSILLKQLNRDSIKNKKIKKRERLVFSSRKKTRKAKQHKFFLIIFYAYVFCNDKMAWLCLGYCIPSRKLLKLYKRNFGYF